MNLLYIDEFSHNLERVLSTAKKYKYSFKVIERRISYNTYFQEIERSDNRIPRCVVDGSIMKEIFYDLNEDYENTPMYLDTTWAAEAYLRIQNETRLTFEAIFIYLPIKEMLKLFNVYHEMDFNQIVDLFKKRFEEESVLDKLLEKFKMSLKSLSEMSGVSYDLLYGLKSRRRDIKKVNIKDIYEIKKVFDVRSETIAELTL